MANRSEQSTPTGSDFEKRGGYPSSDKPVVQLPKVPAGPAPGAPAHSVNNGETGRS